MKLWRYGRAIERLGQRYRLEGTLGSGGMADVCLAWDERAQREVALKVIRPDDLNQRTLNRFLKEAAQIAAWRHPNVVRIYGPARLELLDPAQGSVVPYIVMEYAQGGDLQKRLTPGQPFAFAETLGVFAQICSAVAYAHEQGIIHRDLKPLNILFRRLPNGTELAALSDFGLAVEMDATHFSFAGAGTLPYMAPEQLRGHAEAASDIFALGVILYQLCTGRLPFRRTLQDLHRRAPAPPLPGRLNPDLPPGLDEVILTALASDPRERYPDASQLWEAVYAAVADDPAQAYLLDGLGGSTREQRLISAAIMQDEQAQPSMPGLDLTFYEDGEDLPAAADPVPRPPTSLRSHNTGGRSIGGPVGRSGISQGGRMSGGREDPSYHTGAGMPIRSRPQAASVRRTVLSQWSDPRTLLPPKTRSSAASAELPITQMPEQRHARRRRPWRVAALLLPALAIVVALVLVLPSRYPALFQHVTVPGMHAVSPGKLVTHTISASAPSETVTVTGTGHGHIPGTISTGVLTFLNGAFVSQKVVAGTVLIDKNGIQVTNDNDVNLPAATINGATGTDGTIDVSAHAVNTGSKGNINAHDIDQACCTANGTIFVKNVAAFTGGKDPVDYVFVQQSDVDAAVGPVEKTQKTQVQGQLQRQLRVGERMMGAAQCAPSIRYTGAIGDTGVNVPSIQAIVSMFCQAHAQGRQGG